VALLLEIIAWNFRCNPVLGTPHPWNRCGDIAMVLEEVEMLPSHFFAVVCLAHLAAFGAWEHSTFHLLPRVIFLI